MKPDDEVNLAFDMDFIGLQNYTRELIKYSPFVPFVNAKIIKASKRNVPFTQMDWEVYPPSIYEALKKFNNYPAIKEIIVTENGVAFKDALQNGRIEDTARVNYLNDHIEQVLCAKKEGVKVNGYFVWTLMDNFEWAEGFTPKFGLIHIDFKTQQRIVKDSGKWYAQFLNQSI
jgi:beta-glucosidase